MTVWGCKLLLLTSATFSLFSGCGTSDLETDPRAIDALNQACIDGGQISGEFIVKMSDGSVQLVTAASKKHLLRKLKDGKYKAHAETYEPNYKASIRPVLTTSTLNEEVRTTADFTEGPSFINAEFMWLKGFRGAGSVTALIDSGYDYTHSLLDGTVLENKNDLGNDEDQNGYKGDRFGWDTFNDQPLQGDLGRHGTHVGSLIAGAHKPGYRFSVAPESKIIPIAALQSHTDGDTDATGDSNSIISAINYALSRNVDFINASWGGDLCSSFIRERIQFATEQGVIFITSAGNSAVNLDHKISFPASLPFFSLLTVGASNLDHSRATSSNFGSAVDFFALGSDVVVASPQNQLGTVSGTSVSTPFITGGLALLKNAFPEAPHGSLIKALRESKNEQKIPDLKEAYLILKEL